VQDFEFTVEEGRFHILQSRAARRTPWAALQIACDLVDEGLIDEQAGLGLLAGIDLDSVSRTRLADGVSGSLLAVGIPASPGVACGPMTLNIDTAQRSAEAGRPAILIRAEPTTRDIAGLSVCAALVTSRGARTSHAAVVARQLDLVCVVGCGDLVVPADEGVCRFGNRIIAEGEPLSVDGTTGQIYAGELATVLERPEALIERTKRWAKSP
jgi:pyruvate,orthophosphate dikinase